MRIAVVTDSTADLPAGIAAERGITSVPLTVTVGGRGYLDGVEITPAEFYALQATAGGLATTSQPSPGLFAETYDRLLSDHDHVVSIHISEKLSGTYSSAVQGAAMAAADRVTVIDSAMASMPLGLLVLAAAEAARRGDDPGSLAALVRRLAESTRVYFMVATLENLRRGGRIGRASALLGSVLQVKPVLTIEDGLVTPLERVRTQERALGRVIELARAVDSGSGVCAIVGHAAAEADANRVAAALESFAETLMVQPLGPVVGAHAGAGTVGVGLYPSELFPLGIRPAAAAASGRR